MILLGDCRSILPTLDAGSVRMCCTSPPYWGLRDYGTATWEGGDEACDHIAGPLCSAKSGLAGFTSENIKLRTNGMPFRDLCGKCGARRIDAQFGLEKTPEEYVAAMVGVFREVRRVLAEDGTLWLNLGDSYSGGNARKDEGFNERWHGKAFLKNKQGDSDRHRPARPASGLKPKDLVGIPWRVAFALQADGWYLRSDIIWAKPNPMPESVTDRPTKSHEYVFLLSKSARYFYDAGAIAEESIYAGDLKREFGKSATADPIRQRTLIRGERIVPQTRNARTVWTIPTQPTHDAHFATFPEALAERCILAGSAQGDTVVDPFFGSGTVGAVAERLGRKWIGIELNPAYVGISERKTAQRGIFV